MNEKNILFKSIAGINLKKCGLTGKEEVDAF